MESKSWRLMGGLDLETPPISRHRAPGGLIGCQNYESRLSGYRRIDGYERFDGRSSPSDTLSDGVSDSITNTRARRDEVGEVPGTGDVLGVWRFKDTTYAIRADESGESRMYRSSRFGWVPLNLGSFFRFRHGNVVAPLRNDTLSGLGASGRVEGLVRSVHTLSGDWENGTAEGIIVMLWKNLADAGSWRSGTILNVNGVARQTLEITTSPERIRLADGSNWQFTNYNFFGQNTQQRMYAVCNGRAANTNAFEWDGEAVFPLFTGVDADDIPVLVTGHKNHIMVAYRSGSIVSGALGDPRSFSPLLGASEIAIGDEITGMMSGYRDVMVIWGRNKTALLYGKSSSNWEVKTLSGEAGAMRHTAVLMDEPVCLDDRGIRTLIATDEFGDLSIGVVSEKIRPLLDSLRDGGITPVAAVRVRRKSQYRIFFSDGDCLIATYVQRGQYRSIEYTLASYDLYRDGESLPGVVTSICSEEDSDGRERIFFALKGSGYVYEMDSGTSFDGNPIRAYLRLPYNDFGRPDIIKRFRKLQVEVSSIYESKFIATADFADDQIEGGQRREFTVLGPRSVWGESRWGEFDWGGVPRRLADHRISGRGRNISVLLLSVQTDEYPHVFTGMTCLYNLRKRRL